MEKRPLGGTGEFLSVVGFGGLVAAREDPDDVARWVARAVERGVTYFDVAPEYGNAEELLGPALERFRDEIFLSCKTLERAREGAKAELERSLERLHTDHFDLYQLHGITTTDEVERVCAPGGALEALAEAKQRGLTRYLGFSAHDEEAALTLMDRFDFDAVMFPLNWVCWHRSGFGRKVLAAAREKNMGVIALKALARTVRPGGKRGRWPKCWYEPVGSPEEAALGLRFTLSLPVTVAVSPSHAELLWWMCDVADELVPLSDAESAELARRARSVQPIFPK